MTPFLKPEHGNPQSDRLGGSSFPSEKPRSSSEATRLATQPSSVPVVSVVIPTYNSAAFLREAIQSVLGQTYDDFEIVVVDDGSTDNTESVVHSFGDQVCYMKQQNQGAGAARNHGIKRSRGKYVAFLDADDLWLPGKLGEQIAVLDQDPKLGLVYSDWAVMTEQGEAEPSYLRDQPAAGGYVFNELVQCGFILTSGTIVRRSCLEDVGFFDETLSIAQDYDLWLRVCYRWKIALVNKPLVIKRNRDGNLSSNLTKTAVERIVLFEKALREFPDMSRRSRRLVRRQVALNYWDVGYHYFEGMFLKEARKNFMYSLSYDWSNGRAYRYLAVSCLPASVVRIARAAKRAMV
jgi:glycosyltransferase involved in cell wall biosynthesis